MNRTGWLFSIVLLASGLAAAGDEIAILKKQGQAFSQIARQASPAVAFVKVEKSVETKIGAGGFEFKMPFDPTDEEWLEKFFKRGPGQGGPGGPGGKRPPSRKFFQQGEGSGVLITPDGFLVTNQHVVDGADKILVKLQDGREFQAKLVGADPQSDVAVIKVEAQGLPTLPMGDSDKLEVGEWVLAIGSPFGLSHSVTAGIISAKGRSRVGITDYEDFLQTDAAINPGNSGGPLLNLDGQIIGINTAIFSRSGGSQGIGFAIPVNMVRQIYDQIVKNGSVTRGYLGILIQELTPELAEQFQIKDGKGILVSEIMKDAPAEKAGLKRGDVILELDGRQVEDLGHFRNRISFTPPGAEVTLTILRKAERMQIKLPVGKLDPKAQAAVVEEAETTKKLGLSLQEVSGELAEKMNLDGRGVVIASVEEGSPADRAGLEAGAAVLEINQKEVKTIKEATEALVAAGDGSVLLLIKEKRGTRFVAIKP